MVGKKGIRRAWSDGGRGEYDSQCHIVAFYASEADPDASPDADDSSSIVSIRSCFIEGVGSSDEALDEETSSSASIFLLLPFGAGSSGVRQ